MATKHWLQIALEDAGYESQSYQGRGMFGKQCLAITTRDNLDLFALGMQVGQAVSDDERDGEIPATRTDNMGRGTVAYWPGVPYVGNADSE